MNLVYLRQRVETQAASMTAGHHGTDVPPVAMKATGSEEFASRDLAAVEPSQVYRLGRKLSATDKRGSTLTVHYLITGHTGFKGPWLTLLCSAAATRYQASHWTRSRQRVPAGAARRLARFRLPRRYPRSLATKAAITSAAPDVVVHMAAQSLVRESYRNPRFIYETNALGTLNVLEAVAATPSVRAHIVITTDKVYRNVDKEAGYVETDPLGGDDPYSASKAMADILTQSWVRSFPGCPTAIARGGNVIGGGDVSRERLLPDLIAAFTRGQAPLLGFPRAVRPWQHVLDCLNGYLTLVDGLLAGGGLGELNFGPGRDNFVEVGQVATLAAELWGGGAHWELAEGDHPLRGEPPRPGRAKAQGELGWRNRLGFRDALA